MLRAAEKRLVVLAACGAVAVVLACADTGPAQQGKKKQAEKAEKAAKQGARPKEAEILREAWILMAGANHDYDGHRVKAMHAVHAAVEILDKGLLKNGSGGQKLVAHEEEVQAARAKFVAKQSGAVHEPQQLSDLQMREARGLLLEVQGALAKNKQEKVLAHVNEAIKQVHIALKIR